MPYCNNCGTEYSYQKTDACPTCGMVLPHAVSTMPATAVPRAQKNPAGKRFAAGVIDLAIALAIFAALFFSRRMLLLVIFRRGLAIMIPHLYLLLKDSVEGKSIGKLLTGVMVFNEEKRKPGGFLDSIIRNWYLAIPIIGPTLIAVAIGAQILTGRRQRMGDAGAGTTVIADADYQLLQ